MFTKSLFTVAILASFAGAAHANIVTNADFGNADPTFTTITGWTISGSAGSSVSTDNTGAAGNVIAVWNNGATQNGSGGTVGYINAGGSLSQLLNLRVGDTYTISFLANVDYTGSSVTANASVGGATVASSLVSAAETDGAFTTPFVTVSGRFTATAATETLSFSGAGGGRLFLANVQVNDVTATPEPATLALLAVGAGAAGLVRRRRA